MKTSEKVQENRLRRLVHRLGLAVKKSRVRRVHLDDREGYRIIDPNRNWIIRGEKFNLDLDDVERFLSELEEKSEKDVSLH